MLRRRRRAGTVEGKRQVRCGWGAAVVPGDRDRERERGRDRQAREALDNREPCDPSPPVFHHREEEEGRAEGERGASWRLAPASASLYLAIWCGECAKWWDWEMDMWGGGGGGEGVNRYMQHVRIFFFFFSTDTKRDAALNPCALFFVDARLGIARTFCVCRLQVWCVFLCVCVCVCVCVCL